MTPLKKVWVTSLFATLKGLVLSECGGEAQVELVGYPFGSHPNGKVITVPVSRLSQRQTLRGSQGLGPVVTS